jgi:hypothetical protein
MNNIVKWPSTPSAGDYIALDCGECHPGKFDAGWYCSKVIAVEGGCYRVEYDDGLKLYEIPEFGKSFLSRHGSNSRIFPAI